MGYIVGQERGQSMPFPQAVEEYISAENPVRFIDAFVEGWTWPLWALQGQ